jgi:hypothetical protein
MKDLFGFNLSSVKINDDMSEETTCFSANLKHSGKVVARVRNSGTGGSHMIHWEPKYNNRDWQDPVRETYRGYKFAYGDKEDPDSRMEFNVDIESIIDYLLVEHDRLKDMKRLLRKRQGRHVVVYVNTNPDSPQYKEVKTYMISNHGPAATARTYELIRQKDSLDKKSWAVINDLSDDKLLDVAGACGNKPLYEILIPSNHG